jgi:hypothetical protein
MAQPRNLEAPMKDSHMKILAAIMALLALFYVLPVACSKTHEINGASRKTAYQSAMKVKRYMATNERILFDTALGIVDKIKTEESPDAFADAVDGLTPEEVVDLAKQEVDAKIAAGDPRFSQYKSGEDMLHRLTAGEDKLSRRRPNATDEPVQSPGLE